MEIQKKIVLFSSIKAPEYQYKPQLEQKISEKNILQMCYKNNPDDCFVHLVQSIFSDRYLYQHKSFRDQVLNHKKGFVSIDYILNQSIIKKFIQQLGEQRPNTIDLLKLISRLSTKLICNLKGIRRKHPFQNKIKYSKPLYIEQYPQNDGNQQLQTVLQNTGYIYKIKYNHSQNWATVYAQNPNKILGLQGHFWSIGTYLRIINYQKSQQTFDSPNVWGLIDLLKIHRHSLFDINSIISRHHQNIKVRKQMIQSQYIQNDEQYQPQQHQQMYDQQYQMIDEQQLQWRLFQNEKIRKYKNQIKQQKQYRNIEQRNKIQKNNSENGIQNFKQKQIYFYPNYELNYVCLKYENNNNNKIIRLQNEQKRLNSCDQQQINMFLQQFVNNLNKNNEQQIKQQNKYIKQRMNYQSNNQQYMRNKNNQQYMMNKNKRLKRMQLE